MSRRFILGSIFLLTSLLVLSGCDEPESTDPVAIELVKSGPIRAVALAAKTKIQVMLPGTPQSTFLGGSEDTHAINTDVEFRIVSKPTGSEASLSKTLLVSDKGGNASSLLSTGRVPGQIRVEVRLPSYPEIAPIEVVVLAGVVIENAHQDGDVKALLEKPIRVRLESAPGVPAVGAPVKFTTGGGPSVQKADTETGPDGMASVVIKMGKKPGKGHVYITLPGAPWHVAGDDAPRLQTQVFGLNWWGLAIQVLGGLAIFIFGMRQMSDGLALIAGDRLRSLLNFLTRNRFVAVLAGVVTTGLIQSSSACSVMVIGFVNAGLVQLEQAIGVIMGANIGTTITAQMLSFKLGGLALPAITIGVVLLLLARKQSTRFLAQILIGFGLLFYGMSMMGAPLKELKDSATIISFFDNLSCAPGADGSIPMGMLLKAVLAGTLMTVIVQSSSAAIGLLLAMAGAGLLDPYTAMAVLLGDNIGTTITAVLAAIGSSRTAKRAACAHVLFNVIGVVVMLILFFIPWNGHPLFMELVNRITPGDAFAGENIRRFLANAHTLFNITCTLTFVWCISIFAMICRLVVPGEDPKPSASRLLEPHLLATPSLAIRQAWFEVGVMLEKGRDACRMSVDAILKSNDPDWDATSEKIKSQEREIDDLQTAITSYVTTLSQETLTEEQSRDLPGLLHAVNDTERIGDHAMHILRLAKRFRKQKLAFTSEARKELEQMHATLEAFFEHCKETFALIQSEGELDETRAQELIQQGKDLGKSLKKQMKAFRKTHEARHITGDCAVASGVIFVDSLLNLNRMGGHLTNVLQALLRGEVEDPV